MLPPGNSSQPPPPPAHLLVDLPPEVLDKILASLPCRDVVRTSVLSPPWRHRWKSVPGLDIEVHNVGLGDDTGASWASAVRFLRRCGRPVGRVSIRGIPRSVCRRKDDWVRAVAGKSPRSLSLVLPRRAAVGKPLRSLFRCNTAALTELELRRCAIPEPPAGFAGFHRLTKLALDDVEFTGWNAWEQMEAMVSAAAPTLVELRLENIFFPVACKNCRAETTLVPGRWVIQAPNLRRLVLCLDIGEAGLWELGPLPKLEVAGIFLNDDAEERDYVKMFTAISNVREFHIGNFHMATQAAAINIFQDHLWRFKSLRILRLDTNFNEFPADQLFSLSPFLETIERKSWQQEL